LAYPPEGGAVLPSRLFLFNRINFKIRAELQPPRTWKSEKIGPPCPGQTNRSLRKAFPLPSSVIKPLFANFPVQPNFMIYESRPFNQLYPFSTQTGTLLA
jgi:hypothetical protein